MRPITEIARKAATQHGLLTVTDLDRLGVTPKVRRRLVRDGVLVTRRRGLFRLVGTPESWEQEVMRACLSAATGGVASHRSALRLWGLRRDDDVEVSVRALAAPRVAGAVIHRSYDLEPVDVTWVGGLPVTTPARTLCDAGVHFPDHEVQRLVDAAIGTGLVTVDELQAFRERVGRHGRTGVVALERSLEGLPGQATAAESPKEIHLMRILDDHGLPAPVAQHPVAVGAQRFRLDLAYPEARVLIEYDGYREHTTPEQFALDRQRQNLLVLDGWTVLRFSNVDLRDAPGWVAAQIRDAIARPRLDLR